MFSIIGGAMQRGTSVLSDFGARSQRILLLLIISVFSGFPAFSQSGGTRYVAVENLAVKDAAGVFSRNLGTLPLGREVTVTREDGKWIQIRSGNLSGWVSSSGLTSRRVIAAGSSVTPSEVALAGKGFSTEVEREYRSGGLDYSMVDFMEQQVIPDSELQQFVNEGRLAGGQ
jgi:uncharacterized protein YgiM (DUF1202 family)